MSDLKINMSVASDPAVLGNEVGFESNSTSLWKYLIYSINQVESCDKWTSDRQPWFANYG